MRLHAHPDAHVWTWAVAVAIAAHLRRDLQRRERTRLLVSADSLVMPVYDALARAPLDWERVDVALTDEHWMSPDDPDSHAAAIRRGLLHHYAARARFETLTQPGRRIEDALGMANALAYQPAEVAVLTCDPEGRIAEVCQRSTQAVTSGSTPHAYVASDAPMRAGDTPWARRICLTPAGLSRISWRMLLVRGDAQRRRIELAMAGTGDAAGEALAATGRAGTPLQVHWCP